MHPLPNNGVCTVLAESRLNAQDRQHRTGAHYRSLAQSESERDRLRDQLADLCCSYNECDDVEERIALLGQIHAIRAKLTGRPTP